MLQIMWSSSPSAGIGGLQCAAQEPAENFLAWLQQLVGLHYGGDHNSMHLHCHAQFLLQRTAAWLNSLEHVKFQCFQR